MLAIEGEAGIGKTRLVQSMVDDARSRGLAVFSGRAHPFERTRPFGVVAAALGLNARSPDPRSAAIGALLAGQGADASGPVGDIQFRVVEEIVDLVETACAEHPVLLVAEDIHWADTASLLTILSIARQLPLAPLLVVVTTRPSPLPGDVVRLLDDLAAGGGRTLRLQPLTPDEVAALASHELGASPGPGLTAMLDKAGGNPLWATAMLRSLADEGVLRRASDGIDVTSSELPASLSELVVRRLRDLSAPTLDLLQVTAVLGDAVSLRDVAAVARRTPADVAGQLGEAFDAQLLDEVDERVVFRHQLVHDAIYQHVPCPGSTPPAPRGCGRADGRGRGPAGRGRSSGARRRARRRAGRRVAAGRRPGGVGAGAAGHPRAPPPRGGAAAGRSPRRGPRVGRGGAGAAACRERGRGVGAGRSGARPAARPPRWTPRCGSRSSARWPCRTVPTRSPPSSRPASASPTGSGPRSRR